MLVQDALTGYLHEVPETQLYEPEYAEYPEPMGEVVYDGFGNPVGLPFLAPIAAALAPMAAKAIPAIASSILPAAQRLLPQVGRLVSGLLPGGRPAPVPRLPVPALRTPVMPYRPPLPAFRPPPPLGWIRPPLPYTGLGPRRLYMRCAVWPGPRGLVPAHAATMLPTPTPATAAAAAQQATAMGMRRRRRFRRRR